jgi:hypothetical protein
VEGVGKRYIEGQDVQDFTWWEKVEEAKNDKERKWEE